MLRPLVRRIDAGEVGQPTATRLRVQAFRIARFRDVERHVDEHFAKLVRRDEASREPALRAERRDERYKHDEASVNHQARDFRDAAYVFDAIGLRESQIRIQAVTNVVAIEQIRVHAESMQALLDEVRDRRLAGSRQPGEPYDAWRVALERRVRTLVDVDVLPADVIRHVHLLESAIAFRQLSQLSDHDPTYAAKLISLLRRSGKPAPVFIDGGACRGDFTQLLLDAFPTATIHAFEPNDRLCRDLERRFHDAADVHIWDRALNSAIGKAELHVHADPGTSSLFSRPDDAKRYFHSSDAIVRRLPVCTIDLDTFIHEHVRTGVALLKLDTQGCELDILRGAHGALARQAIDVLYAEFFVVPHYSGAPLFGDLLAFLGSFGYTLFDLFKGPNATNGQLRFGDAIFVSASFRAAHIDSYMPEP